MRLRRADDEAISGVVAGLIMLGALVAFLAYFNAAWVPTYVGNKEADASSSLSTAMTSFAEATEDRIARDITNHSYSASVPLGVTGIPILGSGASSGELAVETAPQLNVTLGSTWIANASGALAATTHTTRFPSETVRYVFGAMQRSQSEGAFVDLRDVLQAGRASNGGLNLTLQVVNLTGGPENVGGTGTKQAVGSVTVASTRTLGAGDVRMNLTGVEGYAWRVAINRTMGAQGLSGEVAANCYASSAAYCFTAATNDATRVDVLFRNVASGWEASYGQVSVEVRG